MNDNMTITLDLESLSASELAALYIATRSHITEERRRSIERAGYANCGPEFQTIVKNTYNAAVQYVAPVYYSNTLKRNVTIPEN